MFLAISAGLDHGDEERWQPTNDTCRGATFWEMQDATADALLASPHFQRRGGADHLLVADSYKTFLLEHDGHFTPKFSKVPRVQPRLEAVSPELTRACRCAGAGEHDGGIL